ncbi:N-acetylmuramoyl-L-alanine amidase [Paenibacillus sp. NPDC056579]|uniref:peptidoglycan recognition protein family protein n=1 Tax=unclassified Paenibacillus TaxID=185978 RepID=UPI001EF98952|nr:N-acetylmuramoyl-L-alanine amidase [Paenibacillus sp. H1-7]ULL15524.1 hypothetical protein DVH26_14370 [Paenibacillus sp. H1-7]
MQYYGIIIHHSACSSINGKGYDYFITRDGSIIPSSDKTDPLYIHICVEGNFSAPRTHLTPAEQEQFFVLNKLIIRLAEVYRFEPDDLFPHDISCPGPLFPWSQLVISPEDRYH